MQDSVTEETEYEKYWSSLSILDAFLYSSSGE